MINATIKRGRGAFLFVLVLLFSYGAANAQDVFISEYIEGSSNNKAIELYNGASEDVDLSSYIMLRANNGAETWVSDTLRFTGTLTTGDVYVIANPSADQTILDVADTTHSMTFYNGDDAIGLFKITGTDTTLIDMFGELGEDPGSAWAVGSTSGGTGEHTLVRKAEFESGNPVPLASFGTEDFTSEWIVTAQNDFSNIGSHEAGIPFNLRKLNRYRELTEFSEAAIESHPLAGESVTFTAVITSYPKSSGLSNPVVDEGSGEVTGIGRIHVFVTDTTANSMGREGMSMQLVETDYTLLEDRTRGDVVTITGSLGFFGGTAQFDVESIDLVGNVNDSESPELAEYAPLIDPWQVSVSDINSFDGSELAMQLSGYQKYNGAYVEVLSATVSNVAEGAGRVDWAINKDGSRVYVYDTSLRYRNDHAIGADGYLESYNARRLNGEDGPFVAPLPGSNVDIRGYVNYVGDDPDALVPSGNGALSINPFEDGVVWVNGNRNVNGEDGFVWPTDLVVNGLPPVVSNVALSDSSVASTDAVTVTAEAEGVDGATITGVNLTYSTPDTSITIAMSATTGNEYEATLPTFENFTPVSFFIEAEDSEGLTGRAPLSGAYNFFVTDEAIASIALLQETADGKAGDSPLLGTGALPVDITATVVASAGESGFIVIQDRAAAWSGVYVEIEDNTETLSIGDQISISELVVNETFDVTSVTLNEFDVLASPNTQVDTLAVSILTQDVTNGTGEYEKYEGVFLTFADVKVTTNQADGSSDFGEWEIGSTQGGGAADTLEAGDGLRVDDNVNFGSTTYGSDLNDHVRVGAMIDSFTGVLHYSFGNPKMILRTVDDVVGDNWSIPDTGFGLESPADEASVTVSGDVTVTWESTTDFDGNDVTYEWVLYSADSSTVVVTVPSGDESSASEVTLPYATVDALLESAGLENGESADFVWNVRVSDGLDTVAVASGYDVASNTFEPLYYSLTLERAMGTSNEAVSDLPEKFDLKQNYPNPFNPTTKIAFDLPQAASVELVVFDMLGRKVATLVSERMTAGTHTMDFNASSLASGMYIYRIEAGSFTSIKKMMLIK